MSAQARHATPLYRLAKRARRHRLTLVATAALVMVLVAGIAGAISYLNKERQTFTTQAARERERLAVERLLEANTPRVLELAGRLHQRVFGWIVRGHGLRWPRVDPDSARFRAGSPAGIASRDGAQ